VSSWRPGVVKGRVHNPAARKTRHASILTDCAWSVLVQPGSVWAVQHSMPANMPVYSGRVHGMSLYCQAVPMWRKVAT
jgi:hypothetical protein